MRLIPPNGETPGPGPTATGLTQGEGPSGLEPQTLAMNHKVQRAIRHLEENVDRPVSRNELAGKVNLAPTRLSSAFKVQTGKTMTQYCCEIKMEPARRLLETTCLTIKQIRNRVGRSEPSHFAKEFRKIFGITPTELRARLHSEKELGGW